MIIYFDKTTGLQFFKGSMWYVCMHVCVCVCTCLYVRMRALALSYVFATPQTAACQAPLSMEFYRQEYWSELPLPFPGDLPDSGIKPAIPCLLHCQVDSLPLSHLEISYKQGTGIKERICTQKGFPPHPPPLDPVPFH